MAIKTECIRLLYGRNIVRKRRKKNWFIFWLLPPIVVYFWRIIRFYALNKVFGKAWFLIFTLSNYTNNWRLQTYFNCRIKIAFAEPHSSDSSVADLRTGGRWFDHLFGRYSFRGLMIVIATGFIPLSPLSIISRLCRKAASGLERILCRVLV